MPLQRGIAFYYSVIPAKAEIQFCHSLLEHHFPLQITITQYGVEESQLLYMMQRYEVWYLC